MILEEQTKAILEALQVLPVEKVQEVRDFALFLKERHEKERQVDESDAWTEEDRQDLAKASWDYAEEAMP